MGTPLKKLTICGVNTCSSVKALLDTGADMTLLSRELADKVGAVPLPDTTRMESATGEAFLVKHAVVAGKMAGSCDGLLLVGIADRKNLAGHDAIIGNDFMSKKCMKIEFESEKCGPPQSIRVGCDCEHFFLEDE